MLWHVHLARRRGLWACRQEDGERCWHQVTGFVLCAEGNLRELGRQGDEEGGRQHVTGCPLTQRADCGTWARWRARLCQSG